MYLFPATQTVDPFDIDYLFSKQRTLGMYAKSSTMEWPVNEKYMYMIAMTNPARRRESPFSSTFTQLMRRPSNYVCFWCHSRGTPHLHVAVAHLQCRDRPESVETLNQKGVCPVMLEVGSGARLLYPTQRYRRINSGVFAHLHFPPFAMTTDEQVGQPKVSIYPDQHSFVRPAPAMPKPTSNKSDSCCPDMQH